MLRQRSILAVAVTGLMLVFASCTRHYRIEGVVETLGYEGREVSLVEFLPFHTTRIDSCKVNHGRFEMKGVVDSTRLVFLCKDDRPIIPVYIEKGRVRIELKPTSMVASGTRQNDLFYSFLLKKIDYDNRYEDMLQRRFALSRSGIDSRRMELVQDSLRMIVDECEEMICSFMADNYMEPAAVGVFIMLSSAPAKEISPLLRRILDSAPDYFLCQSYVNGYIHRMDYSRD